MIDYGDININFGTKPKGSDIANIKASRWAIPFTIDSQTSFPETNK
jgi:hypothetical protein